MTETPLPTARTSDILLAFATGLDGERMTLGTLVDRLGDRAFGLIILFLALPCCIPGVPGLPSIFGIPMALLAAQLVAGRHQVWLPTWVRRRSIKRTVFVRMMQAAYPFLQRVERFIRPRWIALTGGRSERLAGLWMLLMAMSVCLPLPATNTAPAMAIALMAIGFLERDGLAVLAGVVLGVIGLGLIALTYGGLAWLTVWLASLI